MHRRCQSHATETPAPPFSVLISVPDQRLAIVRDGELVARYPISTSRFGTGDRFGSYETPLGDLRVYDKIGEDLSPGAVIRHRSPTGEVLPVNAPGRDPIVTRVIWLDGLQPQNKNALSRGIYIHGTPEERTIGTPVSWGCIRMRSRDVIKFFDEIPVGTVVSIIPSKLPHMHRYEPPKVQPAPPPANDKPAEQEKPAPMVGPSPSAPKEQEKPAPGPDRPSEIAPPNPAASAQLPAIGESPEQGSAMGFRALKGSFLLANLPVFASDKSDDHHKKSTQTTQ
jgi:hypothetical protein